MPIVHKHFFFSIIEILHWSPFSYTLLHTLEEIITVQFNSFTRRQIYVLNGQ